MRTRAGSKTIAAPTGGWNARDALEGMKEQDAVSLVNMFPLGSTVDLRRGYREHATGVGTGAVETLSVFNGADGEEVLLAAGGGSIYDVSAYGDPGVELLDELTEDRWHTINFGGVQIWVNGADQPRQFSGLAFTDATYTGIADDADLYHVTHYKNRLYFLDNEGSIWYGEVDEVTGALVEYPISTLFQNGGMGIYIGTWSKETGTGLENILVAVSSAGELVCFTGAYPGDADTWTIAGRYFLGAMLGSRGAVNMGADLVLLTTEGVFPLSAVLNSQGKPIESARISYKIGPAFKDAAESYGNNIGWDALLHHNGQMLIINVPFASNGASEQYVMNSHTGAWCKFTGITASAWALYNNRPYFGSNDGNIYEFDVQESDNGAYISAEIRQAYVPFVKSNNVVPTMAKPRIRATETINFIYGVDMDYAMNPVTGTEINSGTGGLYLDFDYDSEYSSEMANVSEWRALAGYGRDCSLYFKGDFKDVRVSLSATTVNYEIAGVL